MSLPPSMILIVPLEGSPRLVWDAEHEGDIDRLVDWVTSDPHLLQVLQLLRQRDDERKPA